MERLTEVEDSLLTGRSVLWLNYLVKRYPILDGCKATIGKAFIRLKTCFEKGGKLMVCGNGGSASDAEHISGELMKGFLRRRPLNPEIQTRLQANGPTKKAWVGNLQGALPCIPLSANQTLITAIINDLGGDVVFAQQVLGYGKPNDVLLAISTSGNSANVLKAVWVAKGLGIGTIGLTGATGGELADSCDLLIKVPAKRAHQIQELHLPVYHTLCAMLEDEFFT